MTEFCPFLNPLQRDGTSQNQRLLDALLPENNPIDERSLEDLLAYLQQYAQLLLYYDINNFPSGNWEDFIELDPLKESSDHPPHMALLLAFLKLFGYLQEHLNTLTAKHLDFYYRDTLQLLRKEERPDQVHLIFELAKQIDQHRLEKEVLFKAGKDAKGKNRFYDSDDELVINKAVLSEEHGLKTVFIKKSEASSNNVTGIHAASYANSSDGSGAAIEDEEGKWDTFGNAEMPEATLGFAVASPMFYLAEGERKITVKFYLESLLTSDIDIIKNSVRKHVYVFYSGEKQWVPCSLNNVTISDELDNNVEHYNPSEPDVTPPVPVQPDITGVFDDVKFPPRAFSRRVIDNNLIFKMETSAGKVLEKQKGPPYIEFVVCLKPEDEAVVAYNDEVLQDGFASSLPIVKFALILSGGNKNDERSTAHYAYDYLSKINIESLEINVDVKGVRNLILENDVGVLNPAKPFHPFGAVPKKGSKFYIGSNEVFQKSLETVDLKITWGDLPENSFHEHYAEYKDGNKFIVNNNCHFKAELSILHKGTWTVEKKTTDNKKKYFIPNIRTNVFNEDKTASITFSKFVFKPEVMKNVTNQKINSNLFKECGGLVKQEKYFSYNNSIKRPNRVIPITRFDVGLQSGFMRMELLTSFLHNFYPTALAKAVITNGATIPNIPYTPLITELKLNYTAKETLKANSSDNLIEQLFHITPFGQVEFLPFSIPSDKSVKVEEMISQHLLTDFPVSMDSKESSSAAGTLYIGIEKLKPPQNLSILFQIAESSADPEFDVPTVFWSYLVNNRWVAFTDAEILADKTNGLLTSGIIRFAIPKQITSNNTLLPKDLHWIKASVRNNTTAIAKLIAVKAQVAVASFRNEQNDVSHLGTALPAETISKLKQRNTKIKTISQPFASFDGQLPEHDVAFYRRVSERLRHKGRAITIFDYERLVLEQFPSIYKIKCINHTKKRDEYSPGHVRLIVVPDLRNKNAVDPFRPRATVNMLQQIDRYISRLTSDFVSVEVSNPQYEEIKVDFKVAFHEGSDQGFYLKQLEQDIIKFLSPWLYDNAADISFGGRIHRTWVLNHIEEQEYVDFVTDFRMDHLLDENGLSRLDIEEAIVQSSSSVLVSSKTHRITLVDKLVCKETPLGSRDEK